MADLPQLQRSALGWLSRRDYSEYQLRQKLTQQGATSEQCQQVINWCKSENYLNQQRFVAMLIRSRSNQGYGPEWVRQECRQHQISNNELATVLAEGEPDWSAIARQLCQKKFGTVPATDYKDKMKRMAYLQRRGFSTEQIKYALATE
ncbi:regulatory protein RecX [Chromatiaceae bacterium AAb-1]|nr:regulatory protein RecX [Chromatiaceae bacterium AAb-1]